MTIAEAIAELRLLQGKLHPRAYQDDEALHTAVDVVLSERKQLVKVVEAARIALDSCRAGMKSLTGDGVHSPRFSSDAEQFAAAWRDLREAVDAVRSQE